jgi:RNA polymerase sigma-70 factor (ECF subfamily)
MESDEELMVAVGRGDERALAVLVDRHGASIHGYLTRLCGSRVDAEDLLQDTWLRVARGAQGFDASRRFRPWVYGIATNLARDLGRRRQVRERARGALAALPGSTDGESRVARLDLRERLAQLSDPLREALVLRFYLGLDEAEMAEALGVARGTVKSRLHRALRELERGYREEA